MAFQGKRKEGIPEVGPDLGTLEGYAFPVYARTIFVLYAAYVYIDTA